MLDLTLGGVPGHLAGIWAGELLRDCKGWGGLLISTPELRFHLLGQGTGYPFGLSVSRPKSKECALGV